MSATTIKEFLVGIGYKVDETSERKFVDGVTKATGAVGSLKTAIEALGIGAAGYAAYKWLDNMTSGMEKLYYASKRAGEQVGKMQAFMYAAGQLGSSPEQAQASAVALYQKILNNPNLESNIRGNLGISTRDATGALLGGAALEERIGQALKRLPVWRQNQLASLYEIPMELRQAIEDPDFAKKETDVAAEQKRMGIDPEKAAQKGMAFQKSLRQLGSEFDRIKEIVEIKLVGGGRNGPLGKLEAMLERLGSWLNTLTDSQITNGLKLFGEALAALAALKLASMVANVAMLAGPYGLAAVAIGLASIAAVVAGNKWMTEHPNREDQLGRAVDLFRGMWDTDAARRFKGYDSKGWHGYDNHSGDFHGLPAGGSGGGISAIIAKLETSFALPPGMLHAVMMQESGGRSGLTSSKGAMGLMQLMPATAARFGVTNPNDAMQNLTGGAKYLAWLLNHYNGNVDMALAAYNWGEGNLDRKGWNARPKETRDYVPRIEQMMMNPYRGKGKAAAATGDGSAPNLTSTTTINVSGAGDPMAVATGIAGKQYGVNERLLRNLRQVYA